VNPVVDRGKASVNISCGSTIEVVDRFCYPRYVTYGRQCRRECEG